MAVNTSTMQNQFNFILVVDLEATCCDDRSFSKNETEIIEVGAVIVKAADFTPVDEFQSFVKPILQPKLTQFCTDLTSIEQADVDQAPSFPEVVGKLRKWVNQYPDYAFTSWGEYDRKQVEKDCRHHKINNPLGATHLNLKRLYCEKQNVKKGQSMKGALWLARIPLTGKHHRAIDDARNIVKLLPYVFGGKVIRNKNESKAQPPGSPKGP